jgi:hypothetical protein
VNSASVLDSMAGTLSNQGDPAFGAMLMAAAAAIREQAGARLTTHEQDRCDETLRACRETLGEATFAAAWAEGRLLMPGQAIDLALKPLGAGRPPIAVAYEQQGPGQAHLWQQTLSVHASQAPDQQISAAFTPRATSTPAYRKAHVS